MGAALTGLVRPGWRTRLIVEQQVFADLAAFAALGFEVEFQFSAAGGLEISNRCQLPRPGSHCSAPWRSAHDR